MIQAKRNCKYHNAVGMYLIQHPEKTNNIRHYQFKSKLERAMMSYLDNNPNIVYWKYEPVAIDYVDYTDTNLETGRRGKPRKYYIDFVAMVREANGKNRTLWIEVKASSETKPPSPRASRFKKWTWAKNNCKWAAARKLCESKGYRFLIITENELG